MDEMACNYNMMANCDYEEKAHACEYQKKVMTVTEYLYVELQWDSFELGSV